MGSIPRVLNGLLFVLIIAGGTIPTAGQRPDRGGDQRGGPGGMRGGPGGGMRGGPGGMRGGPGGGMRGGRGGPDAMGFLTRLDRNGNGMLDPDEAQGPARMMLDRVAGPANLDTSRPIPLEEINRAFQRMREERSEGFSRWGGRGDDDDSDNDDRGGGRAGDSQSSGSAAAEPLVPGFGEPDLFDPVPGFGDLAERFAVKIQESDEQQAQRTMGRYDRNRDGVLDEEEIRRARGFRGDPLDTDRNRDGQLSLDELALRYALRRVAEEGSGSDSGASRGRSSNARSDRSSGGGDDDRTARMVDATMQRYDQNRSGVLEKDEWSRFRTDPSAADRNRDDKITRDELAAWMQERLGGGRSRGGSSDDADAGGAGGGGARWGDRTSYRTPTATERLPEGLPEWYARTDSNGDGQVMMSEYAVSWSQRVADDFAQFDLNNDGVITPQECLRAVEAGAVQGAPRPTTSDSGDYSRSRSPAANRSTSPSSDNAASKTSSEASTDQGSVSAKYVKYAVGLIRKYDSNQDGVLTKDEWSSMTKDYSSADTDQDGRLTPTELAAALVQ